jgi:hypothetical protein
MTTTESIYQPSTTLKEREQLYNGWQHFIQKHIPDLT